MYRPKYNLSFRTVNNVLIGVEIRLDGYLGDPIVRRLGASPVLKTQKNGRIISSSVELEAECQVFGEFSEFYTSDPRKFEVIIGRGEDFEGEPFSIWRGYVTPEIYSEPYIAPPYNVRIYANDGLGELKLYDWEPVGKKSIAETLHILLDKAGDEYASVYAASSIHVTGDTKAEFFDDVYIDLDYMDGKTYYDVLQAVLEAIDADIMQFNGDWLIIRESDATPAAIAPSTSDIDLAVVGVSRNGSSYSTAMWGVVRTVGKMGVAQLWPVGFMTRSVEPAKKKVTVKSPWHFANVFADPDMQTDDTWSESGTAAVGSGAANLGSMNVGASSGTISQTFTLKRLMKNIKVTVRAAAQWVSNAYLDGKTRGVGVWARYQVTRTSEIKYYSLHGDSSEWESSYHEPEMQRVDVKNFGASRDAFQELSFDIPSPGVNEEVFLEICIMGYGVNAYHASAVLEDNQGYKDVLLIDNGARGDADEVEITGGRMTSDNITAERFYEGVLVDSMGNAFYEFDDDNNSGKDFMSLNALNRALSVALPRIKISGKFNVPDTVIRQPILIRDGSLNLLVKSFEWDLYNDEITIEAWALPAASLTVASETITTL